MTDRARELLERALDYVHKRSLDEEILRDEIRAYLAQAEVKREALSMKEVASQFVAPCEFDWHAFWDGIRFAEKHHGIGGGDD